MRKSFELEREAVKDVAEFMAAAARTAPKTRGIDNIEVIAIDDPPAREKLLKKMKEISVSENRPSFGRDADSCAASPVTVVIGVKDNPAGLNCGFCGYNTCEGLKKAKGKCSFNSIDLGIASASAVSVAARFYVDNRVMYSIGRAAVDMGLFSKDVKQALGIPLSVTGKSPFFDRK